MLAGKRSFFIVLGLLVIAACSTTKNSLYVDYSSPKLGYSGRIDTLKSKAVGLYWSGTSIKMNFKGKAISAVLEDEKGDNYFNVIVDHDEPFILRPDTIKKTYLLASGLSKGKHSIELFKRTEWDRGKTMFHGFKIAGHANILPKPESYNRRMEFYGNSITAGYAVEDFSGADSPDSTYTNNYRSYARLTAKHFKADYRCICKSGIGITVSWFPMTMPELYDRLDPENADSKWDFSLYTPDIVVVNLFQNDSWLVEKPDFEQFIAKFGTQPPTEDYIINTYSQFVKSIRNKYPKAHIICMLGNMDATQECSKWPSYIEQAVSRLNDSRMYTHFVPYKGTPGHPSISEQEDMSESLVQFIDEHIDW
ncbi:SGNH/GDSL hydrolase family protein [Maribacter luteus]|uniref:Electron transporter RnfD n=1 Tax=Maribacter luteus TaxID=2594478 RepID=A0A6I2MRM5_9FLAO|nr:SGNH/GDSL hydrolase family protein [Maribacter luteus]MRX65502.1 electron transporter RnfD [Maribacter luteus]